MEESDTMFKDLDYLFLREGHIVPAEFQPGSHLKEALFDFVKVLIIGAGGLGCEILKNLALSGFRDISVIDMDHIDITNLNRQFLFREKDVGKFKSEIAAEFIQKKFPKVKVTPYTKKIQTFDLSFYEGFHVIIAGLDNIEARRWLNGALHALVKFESEGVPDLTTVKPFIDGGSEGFKGQARLIMPFKTGCFECSLESLPQQRTYAMCTIAETPRLPEHCIEYAYVKTWNDTFPKKKVNKDSAEDMKWIYERAIERAETFGIEGVSYMLTMGVVKNIIPAIASTNALIAAACVNEAVKIGTYCSHPVENYMMYMGQTSIYTNTFQYEKNPDCFVCSGKTLKKTISRSMKLQDFLQSLKEDPVFLLQNPTINSSDGLLYIPKPLHLEEAHHYKLELTFQQLIDKEEIREIDKFIIVDSVIPSSLTLEITYSD